jgi:hypothetical protein
MVNFFVNSSRLEQNHEAMLAPADGFLPRILWDFSSFHDASVPMHNTRLNASHHSRHRHGNNSVAVVDAKTCYLPHAEHRVLGAEARTPQRGRGVRGGHGGHFMAMARITSRKRGARCYYLKNE